MGIYDRQYYHDEEPPRRIGPSGPRMITTKLIIVTVIIFLGSLFWQREVEVGTELPKGRVERVGKNKNNKIVTVVIRKKDGTEEEMSGADATSPAFELFALHKSLFRDNWKIWQLLSYGFMHADIFHIGLNMLGLFVLGRDVELRYGRWEMLRFYLLAIVVSGASWLLIQKVTPYPSSAVEGASGAVIAILILYCLNFPQRRLLLMGIVPIPAWGLGLGVVLIDLFCVVTSLGGNTAYEAHLAGAAFALLYFKCGWNFGRIPSFHPRKWFKRRPRLKLHHPEAEDKKDIAADKILEKIRQDGESSLSRKERRILEDYSRRMRKKHHS